MFRLPNNSADTSKWTSEAVRESLSTDVLPTRQFFRCYFDWSREQLKEAATIVWEYIKSADMFHANPPYSLVHDGPGMQTRRIYEKRILEQNPELFSYSSGRAKSPPWFSANLSSKYRKGDHRCVMQRFFSVARALRTQIAKHAPKNDDCDGDFQGRASNSDGSMRSAPDCATRSARKRHQGYKWDRYSSSEYEDDEIIVRHSQSEDEELDMRRPSRLVRRKLDVQPPDLPLQVNKLVHQSDGRTSSGTRPPVDTRYDMRGARGSSVYGEASAAIPADINDNRNEVGHTSVDPMIYLIAVKKLPSKLVLEQLTYTELSEAPSRRSLWQLIESMPDMQDMWWFSTTEDRRPLPITNDDQLRIATQRLSLHQAKSNAEVPIRIFISPDGSWLEYVPMELRGRVLPFFSLCRSQTLMPRRSSECSHVVQTLHKDPQQLLDNENDRNGVAKDIT